VREWLDRAVGAMPDPRYVCARCSGENLDWHSLCPHCGAFDALSWRTPAWAAPGGNPPIAAEPRAAPELVSPLPQLPVAAPNGLAPTLEQAKNPPAVTPR
jgi:HemY protein